jgi:beta-glucosidase/6-phospho-beta-glucosidase/beta-galactosidase
MGIEWSRVQPRVVGGSLAKRIQGKRSPFDHAALDYYVRMFAAARRHGLEPVVTLHHFVHPAWLGPDPWLDDETRALPLTFAKRPPRASGSTHRCSGSSR